MTFRCSFRKAKKRDKAVIFSLYKQVMGHRIAELWGWNQHWQENDFNQHFDTDNITLVLVGHRIVGYCQVEEQVSSLFIRMLLLLPEFQGKGIGTRLLGDVIESARVQSKDVSLKVFKVNKRAKRFYQQHGFKVTESHASGVTMTRLLD